MRILDMDKPGITLKLSPDHAHEIFEALDDEGKQIRLTGEQIVKVDELNRELHAYVNEGRLLATQDGEQGEDFDRLHNGAYVSTEPATNTETAAANMVDVDQDTVTHPERY